MDPSLRHAWTEIARREDYDQHMADVGEAKAAADLTNPILQTAALTPGSTVTAVGGRTGQMFQRRLTRLNVQAETVEDDIENTRLPRAPDLLLATLLLEHIDWPRGVEAIASLKPKSCGIILQENPPGMTTGVTPGRRLPTLFEKAVESAHATLVSRDELTAAFQTLRYHCRDTAVWEAADRRRLVALLFLIVMFVAMAAAQTVRQGATLRLHGPATAVSARIEDRSIKLFPEPGDHSSGLMPVPALQKPGDYKLEFLDKSGATVTTESVHVLDAHFRKQNVTLAEGVAELKPSPGESETVTAFREAVSDVRYWEEPLTVPVKGCMTSPFGVQRYLNGKPTGNFHAGLDQRSPAGTPVRAAAGGVVKIVREWNLHGRTVAIDHGQGLESIYLHMSKLAATEGVIVKKGDVIGYVGSTGRSTAPHLHWSIYVNGVPVNPRDWVTVFPCPPKK